MSSRPIAGFPPSGNVAFTTTRWSVVLQASSGQSPEAVAALDQLCRIYWYPLYAFVRRRGYSAEDAEDLLQSFFARLIEKEFLKDVDQSKGRFRSFLLAALKHFLSKEWVKSKAQKRGGQAQHVSYEAEAAESSYRGDLASDLTPEKLYEQRWAVALLESVMHRLEEHFAEAGKAGFFEVVKGFLVGQHRPQTYAQAASQLSLSEAALRMKVQRMRHRYQQLVREEIAHTVANPEEVEDEIRYLLHVLSS
ncbi:MAG: RNA polymerase sigma factor [Verrucomicrobiia bacterium]